MGTAGRRQPGPHRYPLPHRLAWNAGVGDARSGYDESADFLFGVDLILDGVQALIEKTRVIKEDSGE